MPYTCYISLNELQDVLHDKYSKIKAISFKGNNE